MAKVSRHHRFAAGIADIIILLQAHKEKKKIFTRAYESVLAAEFAVVDQALYAVTAKTAAQPPSLAGNQTSEGSAFDQGPQKMFY